MQDTKRFWQARARSKRALERKLAALPYEEKLAIVERMKKDQEALRNAKPMS